MSLRHIALVALLLAGCDRAAPPAERAVPDAPGKPAGRTPYTMEVVGFEGPIGEEGYVVVAVEARDGHKINKEYPFKLVLDQPPAALELPLRTLALADASLDGDRRLTFSVPATARSAGEYTVSGLLRLSVCNDDQCRIEKEQVSARVVAQ